RRKPDHATGLDHELELAERIGNRLLNLAVARDDAVARKRLVDLEGDLAGLVGQERIADRSAHLRVALASPAAERAHGIVEALRLRRIDRGFGRGILDRK